MRLDDKSQDRLACRTDPRNDGRLRTGRQAALFEFTSGCQELYDVQFIPRVRRPMILNLEREAARQAFTAPDFSYWLRPSSEVPPPSGTKTN